MRDLFLLAFLGALFLLAARRPFLFVLTYVYIDIVSPQHISYYLLNAIPVSMIAFAAAGLSWLVFDDKRDSRFAPRQALMLVLLGWCWFTTSRADFPIEAAFKWDWVWKAMVFAIFLPLTLRTKLRIEALLLFILLSVSAIVITGGLKTVLSGGGYGQMHLLVSNNSGIFESSIASTVAIAMIPIILWFMKFGTIFPPDWRVRLFGSALIFACLILPIGTAARTGLICIAVLAVLMLRDAKRRMLYIGGAVMALLLVIPFLPSAYTERMETIRNYQADASASTRIMVWNWTLDYVKQKPLGGGFDAYRQNELRYETTAVVGTGPNQTVQRQLVVDQARAYHSAYFEMLGEQGWPGLILWLVIHGLGFLRMEILRRRYRSPREGEAWISPLATALQHCHIIYMVGALFVGIALNPFIYLIIGAQIGLDTYVGRLRRADAKVPLRPKRPQLVRAEG